MTITDTGTRLDELLPTEMLERFDDRAPTYDRDNDFFAEDFEELKDAGFLDIALPVEMGGRGMDLLQVSQAMRRLAYVAPATALAVNMHVYWTGVAADMAKMGDDSGRVILERAAAGEVLAALHGEVGNDLPLLLSTSSAERTDGGWTLNGHKIFGSLSPVWTLGGFHAMDTSDPDNPVVVHGFIPKDTKGLEIVDTWDTLGMRATQSHDTLLSDAFAPDELIVRVVPAGFAGADFFHVAIFAWALTGFASVYHALARRAFDMTLESVHRKSSIAMTRPMAYHPEVQHNIGEMRIALDAGEAYLDRTAGDWAAGVEHADWPLRMTAMRYRVITESFDIVDRAMDLTGGGGAFKRSRMEQIFRDARMGRFHPGNTLLAHELVAKMALGIDPDESPRWG